jgi:hypothetical protein
MRIYLLARTQGVVIGATSCLNCIPSYGERVFLIRVSVNDGHFEKFDARDPT